MWSSNSVLLTFFLIAYTTARHLPSFTKHMSYAGSDFVLTYALDDEISFARATCSRRNVNDGPRVMKNCRLVLETTVTAAARTFTQTCDVRLYPKWIGGVVARQFKLVRFGFEHLVLVWRETIDDNPKRRPRRYIPYPVTFDYRKDHLRVKVVNMRNCQSNKSQELQLVSEQRERMYEPKICISNEECARNKTEIFAEDEEKIHNVNVVVTGDKTFDVYYRNAHVCGKERRCKVTYDAKTEKFGAVEVSPLQLKYDATLEIHPISTVRDASNVLAYVVRSLHLDDGSLTLFDVLGRPTYEHTYSWSPYNVAKGISHMAMSTLEEILGFCQQPIGEPVIQCSVFDSQGVAKFGVDVALKSPDVALIKMRNTDEWGFFLLIGYGNSTTENGLEDLDVLRVDRRGELANVYSAGRQKCSLDRSGVDVALFRNGTEVCYYMVCTYPMPRVNGEETHWQVFGECFGKDWE